MYYIVYIIFPGTNKPRVSVTGAPLPSARAVSQQTTITADEDYKKFTLMVMQWGQFLDHDVTHTALSKGIQIVKLLKIFYRIVIVILISWQFIDRINFRLILM